MKHGLAGVGLRWFWAAAAALVALAVGAVLTTGATIAQSNATSMSIARAVGQLVIAGYKGVTPPPSLLGAIRAGHVGGVVLMGYNTAAGNTKVKAATTAMQRAAMRGGNPPLLIMTDQEGGEVKRLVGPPVYSAAHMSSPTLARAQGLATGRLLRSVGINVDLAPVADVERVDGFIQQEQRSFGRNPAVVARAACAFAGGLAQAGIGYTLKHYPGLGDAINSTDVEPVSIGESAADVYSDDAVYRRCGHGSRLALVMLSSASYPNVIGNTPAVLTRKTYTSLLRTDHVTALPITDSFETGAIEHRQTPALRAVNAGVDMVMYLTQGQALGVYSKLLAQAMTGQLGHARVEAAALRVEQLKASLPKLQQLPKHRAQLR